MKLSLLPIAFLFLFILTSCGEDPTEEEELYVTFGVLTKEFRGNQIFLTTSFVRNGGNLEEAGFLFGEAPALTIDSAERIKSETGDSFTVSKSGLISGKQYYARPYAIVDGLKFEGIEITFATLE